MNQIEKIESRSHFFDLNFLRKPENQKFFPFYYFTNFEVLKTDPVVCEYCGEELSGNGHYATAYFVWESRDVQKVCCSVKHCFPGFIWPYHSQVYGQPKPLSLPTYSTTEQRLVYRWAFGNGTWSTAYKIMQYRKIDTWEQLKEIICKSEHEGGTYGIDGAAWYEFNGEKPRAHNLNDDSEDETVISLSRTAILGIVNEMLAAMYLVQLKLF